MVKRQDGSDSRARFKTIKLDVRFPINPKLLTISPAAESLWIRSLAFSHNMQRDGELPANLFSVWLRPSDPAPLAQELVQAGFWIPLDGGGYLIHDFHVYHPSRAATEKQSRTNSANAKQRSGRKSIPEQQDKRVADAVPDKSLLSSRARPDSVSDSVSDSDTVDSSARGRAEVQPSATAAGADAQPGDSDRIGHTADGRDQADVQRLDTQANLSDGPAADGRAMSAPPPPSNPQKRHRSKPQAPDPLLDDCRAFRSDWLTAWAAVAEGIPPEADEARLRDLAGWAAAENALARRAMKRLGLDEMRKRARRWFTGEPAFVWRRGTVPSPRDFFAHLDRLVGSNGHPTGSRGEDMYDRVARKLEAEMAARREANA